MGVRIVTDSTADIPKSMAERLGIEIVPLKVHFKDKQFIDGVDIDSATFFRMMREAKDIPTTSQVNPDEFEPIFRRIREAGDEILGIFLSSKMSGTAQSAFIARQNLGDEGIHLVDTGTVTFAEGLLVLEAVDMAKNGMDAASIAARLEEMKGKCRLYAVVDTLEYLKKGGRLSPASAILGTVLNIKPVITVENGLVDAVGKARGTQKAFDWMEQQMKKNGQTLNGKRVALGHTDSPEKLAQIKEWLMKRWAPTETVVSEIGTVVGAHAGPGCTGFAFIED